jgi:hypothetical protein
MTNSKDLEDLINAACSSGVLSPQSQTMLTGHLGGVVIAGAAGTAMEDIRAADVTLITVLIDASSSIRDRGLEKAVREGQNLVLDAFAGSKEVDSILVALWLFNDQVRVSHSYVPVPDAARLDAKSYSAMGSTVLYDAWCDALASNVAYAQRLRDSGTPTRSVAVVITDGEDTGSKRTAAHCARLTKDLLASEQFVLGFVGVGDDVDFFAVARSMGLPDRSILVQKDVKKDALRRAFQLVSQSAIRASQGLIKPGAQAGFFGP